MGELGFLLRLRTRRGRLSGGGETLCLGGGRGERLLALSERLLPLPLGPGELHGAFGQALLDDLLLAQQLLVRLTRGALVRANLVDFIAAAGGHVGVTPQLVLELAQLALVRSPRLELLRTQHARGGDGVISLAGQLGELVAMLLLQLAWHTMESLTPLWLMRRLRQWEARRTPPTLAASADAVSTANVKPLAAGFSSGFPPFPPSVLKADCPMSRKRAGAENVCGQAVGGFLAGVAAVLSGPEEERPKWVAWLRSYDGSVVNAIAKATHLIMDDPASQPEAPALYAEARKRGIYIVKHKWLQACDANEERVDETQSKWQVAAPPATVNNEDGDGGDAAVDEQGADDEEAARGTEVEDDDEEEVVVEADEAHQEAEAEVPMPHASRPSTIGGGAVESSRGQGSKAGRSQSSAFRKRGRADKEAAEAEEEAAEADEDAEEEEEGAEAAPPPKANGIQGGAQSAKRRKAASSGSDGEAEAKAEAKAEAVAEADLLDEVAIDWEARHALAPASLSLSLSHDNELRETIGGAIRFLGGTRYKPAEDVSVTARTSHLIVDDGAVPKRTLKLLHAMARGLPVVRASWLLQSVSAGRWLDWERFQALPAHPHATRQLAGKVFYIGDSGRVPRADLEALISLAGGKVGPLRCATHTVNVMGLEGSKLVSTDWVLAQICEPNAEGTSPPAAAVAAAGSKTKAAATAGPPPAKSKATAAPAPAAASRAAAPAAAEPGVDQGSSSSRKRLAAPMCAKPAPSLADASRNVKGKAKGGKASMSATGGAARKKVAAEAAREKDAEQQAENGNVAEAVQMSAGTTPDATATITFNGLTAAAAIRAIHHNKDLVRFAPEHWLVKALGHTPWVVNVDPRAWSCSQRFHDWALFRTFHVGDDLLPVSVGNLQKNLREPWAGASAQPPALVTGAGIASETHSMRSLKSLPAASLCKAGHIALADRPHASCRFGIKFNSTSGYQGEGPPAHMEVDVELDLELGDARRQDDFELAVLRALPGVSWAKVVEAEAAGERLTKTVRVRGGGCAASKHVTEPVLEMTDIKPYIKPTEVVEPGAGTATEAEAAMTRREGGDEAILNPNCAVEPADGSWRTAAWLDSQGLAAAAIAQALHSTGCTSDELAATCALASLSEEALAVQLEKGGLANVLARGLRPSLLQLTQEVTGAELREQHGKFHQDGVAFELKFGEIRTFFAGLEAQIGPPEVHVALAIEFEHTSAADSNDAFTTSNY
eukprot:jgi/Chrpa1/15749/Chrysochromulina_OHIO_Genome00016609-RA